MTVESVVRLDLPVAEALEIRRTRLGTPGPGRPRLAVVSGTHGDELEGLYVTALLAAYLEAHEADLDGVIDLYPALNPLGIDTITRTLPVFDLDLNRSFRLEPGAGPSFVAEVTEAILASLAGASVVIDIHASNIFLRETPQVRLSATSAETLLPLARKLNTGFLWVHEAVTVLENTLAHSLNRQGTPCLVVEMGVGMRLTPSFCQDLVDGILALAAHLGLWRGPVPAIRQPLESPGGTIRFLNAPGPGLFVPEREHGVWVEPGDCLGAVVDPQTGRRVATITAPARGLLFTLREYPVVMEGSLLARLWEPGGGA